TRHRRDARDPREGEVGVVLLLERRPVRPDALPREGRGRRRGRLRRGRGESGGGMSRFTVVIADDRYAAYDEEKAVFAEVDAEVRVFASSSPSEARAVFARADAILVNLF